MVQPVLTCNNNNNARGFTFEVTDDGWCMVSQEEFLRKELSSRDFNEECKEAMEEYTHVLYEPEDSMQEEDLKLDLNEKDIADRPEVEVSSDVGMIQAGMGKQLPTKLSTQDELELFLMSQVSGTDVSTTKKPKRKGKKGKRGIRKMRR